MTVPGLTVPEALLEDLADRIAARLRVSTPAAHTSRWLDVDQAAEYIATNKRRIYDLAQQQRIPVHREGARLLFDRDELDAWIRDGRAASTNGGGG